MADFKMIGVVRDRDTGDMWWGTVTFPSQDTENFFNANGDNRWVVGADGKKAVLESWGRDFIQCSSRPEGAVDCGIES